MDVKSRSGNNNFNTSITTTVLYQFISDAIVEIREVNDKTMRMG